MSIDFFNIQSVFSQGSVEGTVCCKVLVKKQQGGRAEFAAAL